MARSDIQIDTSTNDLIIEKSKNISYSATKSYLGAFNNIDVQIEIPSRYADGKDERYDWRNLITPVRSLDEVSGADSTADVYVTYITYDFNGLVIPLTSQIPLFYKNEYGETKFVDYEKYVEIINSRSGKEDFMFTYDSENEIMLIKTIVLGDFVAADNIDQNEYILLNINEGAFLQNPTFGIGISNYLNAPISEDTMFQNIIDKMAQDALRVIYINKEEEVIRIDTEDFNTE